jgi:hypothetical protein
MGLNQPGYADDERREQLAMPGPMREVIAVRNLLGISVGADFMHVTVRDERRRPPPAGMT